MYNRKEAFVRTKEFKAINDTKNEIEKRIDESIEAGKYWVSVDLTTFYDLSKDAILLIIEWIEGYGYKVDYRTYYDAQSGWDISCLDIYWSEEKEKK